MNYGDDVQKGQHVLVHLIEMLKIDAFCSSVCCLSQCFKCILVFCNIVIDLICLFVIYV